MSLVDDEGVVDGHVEAHDARRRPQDHGRDSQDLTTSSRTGPDSLYLRRRSSSSRPGSDSQDLRLARPPTGHLRRPHPGIPRGPTVETVARSSR